MDQPTPTAVPPDQPITLLLWGVPVPAKDDEEQEEREPTRLHGMIEPSRREGD